MLFDLAEIGTRKGKATGKKNLSSLMGARAAGKFGEVWLGVWSLHWRCGRGTWWGNLLCVLLLWEQLCFGCILGTVADRATVQLWKLKLPC